MFKFLSALYKPKKDLSKIYSVSMFLNDRDDLAPYPKKDFMAEQGVYAYRLQFMATEADPANVFGLIASYFSLKKGVIYQEGEAKHVDGTSIHFSIRQEFNGAVIELVTNATPFLLALDKLNLKPPPPWLVFPELDPETLGGRQGAIDYWWTWYWSPFWDSRSKDEQIQFLKEKHASPEWAEYINLSSQGNTTAR